MGFIHIYWVRNEYKFETYTLKNYRNKYVETER